MRYGDADRADVAWGGVEGRRDVEATAASVEASVGAAVAVAFAVAVAVAVARGSRAASFAAAGVVRSASWSRDRMASSCFESATMAESFARLGATEERRRRSNSRGMSGDATRSEDGDAASSRLVAGERASKAGAGRGDGDGAGAGEPGAGASGASDARLPVLCAPGGGDKGASLGERDPAAGRGSR